MKTQIIHLDAQDDVASASDKMSWAGCEEILLIWPEPPAALRTRLDLALLSRHARRLGARLGLVARHPETILHAAQLGIPTFRTVRLARQLPWEPARPPGGYHLPSPPAQRRDWREIRAALPARNRPAGYSPGLRAILFGLGVAASLALASLAVPRARVVLNPQTRPQTLELNVSADPGAANFNLAGLLPAREIEVIVEGRKTSPVSGALSIPLSAAHGIVELSNLTGEPLSIPAGTLLRTVAAPFQRFLTAEAVELPGEPGARVEVEARAETPGAAGNLAAQTTLALEGDLGLKVSALNPLAFAGGQEQTGAAPSPEDYDALRADLLETLWQSALEEAARGPAAGGLVLSAKPEVYRLVLEEFEPSQPQPASELGLRLQVAFTIQFVPREALEAFGQAVMDAAGPAGFEAVPGTLSASILDIPIHEADGAYSLRLLMARTLQAHVDPLEVTALSAGKTPAAAAAALSEGLLLESPPVIVLNIPWWPLLPWLPSQFQVER